MATPALLPVPMGSEKCRLAVLMRTFSECCGFDEEKKSQQVCVNRHPSDAFTYRSVESCVSLVLEHQRDIPVARWLRRKEVYRGCENSSSGWVWTRS